MLFVQENGEGDESDTIESSSDFDSDDAGKFSQFQPRLTTCQHTAAPNNRNIWNDYFI